MIEYINAEQQPSVVIFENLSPSSVDQESIQDDPLVWPIVAKTHVGAHISHVNWCKTNLKG